VTEICFEGEDGGWLMGLAFFLRLDDGVPLGGLPARCQPARKSGAVNATVSQAGDTRSEGRGSEVVPS
jgi:hypothetical protein